MAKNTNDRRKTRTRFKLRQTDNGRARLSVHRSNQHIYAQIVDDERGVTLASASSANKEMKKTLKVGSNIEAAKKVGEAIAKAAQSAKVKQVKFDRGQYKYHGRVKALAEAARAAGLEF